MAGSIYACLFSTGLVKVGRSIDPVGRMAAHADRVSCVGIEIVRTHAAVCVSDVVMAERELIKKCIDACSKRNKEEWFEWLEFDFVIELIDEISQTEFIANESKKNIHVLKAISIVGSLTALSELVGQSPQVVANWRVRQVPAEHCPAIEKATNGAVRCEDLRDDVDWAYLRGTKRKVA